MTGFAIIVSGCQIVPPSAKAALLLVMWMFGTVPGISYEEYRDSYRAAAGAAQTAEVEACFAKWPGK